MSLFQIYREPADTDEPRQFLGELDAGSMSQALDLASQYYEIPAHDLVAVQLMPENKQNPFQDKE